MKIFGSILIVTVLVVGGCVLVFQPSKAFDPKIEAELKYSRDTLVKQRTDLETDLEHKAKQVAQLELEIQKTRAHLKDTEHALGLINTTLKHK